VELKTAADLDVKELGEKIVAGEEAMNGVRGEQASLDQAGDLLRTSTQPTLHFDDSSPRIYMSIVPKDKSYSDLVRVLVLNELPALTDVESPPPPPRICTSIHPNGRSCSDLASSACPS